MVASVETTTAPGTSIFDAVRELASTIAARADEIEAARRLPPDLVTDLTAAGCFGMPRPRSHGGAGVDLVTSMRVYEDLSRADASVGWTVAIGAGCWLDLVGCPGRRSKPSSPTIRTSRSAAPSGRRGSPHRPTVATA
jgi:alkylation response protein AidB-like acyl-CoA dehydrogenase